MTLGGLAVASTAKRSVPLFFPEAPRNPEEDLLRTGLVAVLLILWSVVLLGSVGWLHPLPLLALTGALFALSRRIPSRDSSEPGPRWSGKASLPMALAILFMACNLWVFLPAVPTNEDAMAYHLHFPARWLQAGQLSHIPVVFGDNAAAYAPQNGAVFYAWQMALSGRDATTNISQAFGLGGLFLLGLALGRRLGVAASWCGWAALLILFLHPLHRWTYSANVDVFMVAFALMGLHFSLGALQVSGRDRESMALAAGLALGVALGTKTVAATWVVLLTVPMVLGLLLRREVGAIVRYFGGLLAGGGWWWVQNLWFYGNPLFPLRWNLGPIEFPGAYDKAAVEAGEFHLDGVQAVAGWALGQLGWPTFTVVLVGWLALLAQALKKPREESSRVAGSLLACALVWCFVYALVIPHNDRVRFLLPALILGLVGWGPFLQFLESRLRGSGRVAVGAAAVALLTRSRPWTERPDENPLNSWWGVLRTLHETGTLEIWILASLVAVFLWGLTWWLRRGAAARRASFLSVLGFVLAGLILVAGAGTVGDLSRETFFLRANFRTWANGYLSFQRPALNTSESPRFRVAYTGMPLPYVLTGSGWRHQALYVNTMGQLDDAFHDFWWQDPRSYDYHRPPIYRGDDRFDVWLSNLREAEVDLVVTFALHPLEQRWVAADGDGFPIEKRWVKGRPDLFQPLVEDEQAGVYALVPDPTESVPEKTVR